MSDPPTPLLALALDSAAFGPGQATASVDPAAWLELVSAAEGCGVSLVTLADTHRADDGVPRLDALMLAAWLGARTRRIGILASADTTVTEPYLLASQVGTADFVSAGRAGWVVQVSGGSEDGGAGGYVGPREAAVGPAAWSEAAEFVEVVRALWDSWEDDAEIRDISNHRFIDGERIHPIDFAGEHMAVKGPSITPRSPQGQPPVAVCAGGAGPALELAVNQADVVFLTGDHDPATVRAAAGAQGRELRLFLDLSLDTVVAGDLRQSVAAGFDGVRLIATEMPEQLARLNEIATGEGSGSGSVAFGTLRDQLGLSRPPSRYAAALSSDGASR